MPISSPARRTECVKSVSSVEGSFDRGDAVIIRDASGTELGRGLSAYSHQDAKTIIGHKSREITELLGYRGRDELIHRDNMALKQGGGSGE